VRGKEQREEDQMYEPSGTHADLSKENREGPLQLVCLRRYA
jgi:hypothetical protein